MKKTRLALIMNKKLLTASLLLTLLLISLAMANPPASAQSQQSSAPALDWQKTFGGDGLTWVAEANDGGYVFFYPGYYSTYYGPHEEPATLTEVGPQGYQYWTRNFSLPFPEAIATASDGGFAYTTLNDSVLSLSKLNSYGYSLWNQTFAGSFGGSQLLVGTNDGGFAVTVHNDTGYAHVGNEYIDVRALMIFKTDSQGAVQWTKTFDSLNSSYTFRSLIQTSDGGYALAGSFGSSGGLYPLSPPISNASDFCLVKISSDGNLQWTKTYGGANDDDANSFVQTNDGGYALVGNTRSFGAGESDALMVKTDPSGNLEWAHSYGGYGQTTVIQGQTDFQGKPIADIQMNFSYPVGSLNDFANCIVQTKDGGLAFAGATQWTSPSTFNLIWLVKTDANGAMQWNQTYANFESTPVYALKVRWDVNSLIQAKDGSFVMVGLSGSDNAHNQVSFLVKTKPAIALPTTSPAPSPMPSLAFQYITINADGTITPPDSPITHVGNEYKLTGDIHNPLIVKADNIIVNGQGHLLNGNGTVGNLFVLKSQIGVDLLSVKNVTVRDFNIQNFKIGILLDGSDNATASQNTLTLNNQGILGINSSDAVIEGNDFSNRYQEAIGLTSCLNSKVTSNKLTESGISIDNSNGNVISNNDFNQAGIGVHSSNNTLITANNFYKGWVATSISDSSDIVVAANNYTDCNIAVTDNGVPGNLFFMNSFINSTYPPDMSGGTTDNAGTPINMKDFWDNGKAGNYWSNYTQRYPNAQPASTSGTWDTPYAVSGNNTDYHPLVAPVTSDAALALSQALNSIHFASSPTPTPSPSPTPTPTLSPSPSIPEFPSWIILPLIVTGSAFLIIFKKRVKRK